MKSKYLLLLSFAFLIVVLPLVQSAILYDGVRSYYEEGGINYSVYIYTGNGTFNITSGTSVADILIVGGGGGGGGSYYSGGGGGAGGLVFNSSITLGTGNYVIRVGLGGNEKRTGGSGADDGFYGQASSFDTTIAFGGGGGGGYGRIGLNGGSGGGGGGTFADHGLGISGQGYDGGLGNRGANSGGGGGGSSEAGNTLVSFGGNGTLYNITNGTNLYYAGGGGAGNGIIGDYPTYMQGGRGGGGDGGADAVGKDKFGKAGINGTGGGGGGGATPAGWGGMGGSGIVIIKVTPASVIPIDVVLTTPVNNANVTNEQNTFTCSVTSVNPTQNLTLNLWNPLGTLIYSVTNTSSLNTCYQETANVSTACGGYNNGTYKFKDSTLWYNPLNVYDGDWNTFGYNIQPAGGNDFYVNYSKPAGAVSSSKWQVKVGDPINNTNYTIPALCFAKNPIELRIASNVYGTPYVSLYCKNSTSWIDIAYIPNLASAYEESMWWDVTAGTIANTLTASTILPSEGNFTWNCLAFDDTSEFNWSVSNYTLNFQANITDYNETYHTDVLEQSSYYFNTTINFTNAGSNATARLLYNGTYYNADGVFINGTNYTYYKKLNIPYIPNNNFVENRSFYWVFNLSYGTTYHSINSSGYSQLVHAMRLTNSTTCNNEPFLFYNLTYADELTQLGIPFVENYWNFTLVNPENTTFKRYFFGNWNNSFHNFCANYTSAKHYFAVKSTYSQINFPDFFSRKDPICKFANTSSENRTLYLLSNTSTDYLSFYFNIKDQTQVPINGAYIYFEKKVNNVWEYLGGEKADVYGNVVAKLIPNSPYKITIKSPDCVQLKVEEVTLICQSLPCTNDIIISETQNPYQLIEELPLFNWTMQYYNATKSVNMTFIDSGAGVSYVQFITYQRLLSTGDTQVCSNTSYLSSETLSCGIGSRTGSFISYLYVHKTDGSVFTRVYTFETKEPVTNFGKEGLLWAFFIVAVLFFIGIYNPVVAVVMAVLGLVIMAVVGFIALPWLFFVLLGTISVIIIIKLKS